MKTKPWENDHRSYAPAQKRKATHAPLDELDGDTLIKVISYPVEWIVDTENPVSSQTLVEMTASDCRRVYKKINAFLKRNGIIKINDGVYGNYLFLRLKTTEDCVTFRFVYPAYCEIYRKDRK